MLQQNSCRLRILSRFLRIPDGFFGILNRILEILSRFFEIHWEASTSLLSLEDSFRILSRFLQDSFKIPSRFLQDSFKILVDSLCAPHQESWYEKREDMLLFI